jgi:hypothetical protein
VPETHILISSVKDEGPFLLEWVAHHLCLGFDRVIVASNDCTDGTGKLLHALDRMGAIAHVSHAPGPGDVPQHAGYRAIRERHPIDEADWLMMLDVDEFLNVHAPGHRVGDLTALAPPRADVIALNAMCFTGEPDLAWRPGRVTGRYVRRLAVDHPANGSLKTLTRGPSRFREIHNHSMMGFQGPGAPRVMYGDGRVRTLPEGEPLWRALRTRPAREGIHRLAQVDHHSARTPDAFALRRLRGRGAVAPGAAAPPRHTEAYWWERSRSAGQDRSIGRYAQAVDAMMARLLENPGVRARHEACEVIYAERLRNAAGATFGQGPASQASGWRQEAE